MFTTFKVMFASVKNLKDEEKRSLVDTLLELVKAFKLPVEAIR